jgi:hypothetical protein
MLFELKYKIRFKGEKARMKEEVLEKCLEERILQYGGTTLLSMVETISCKDSVISIIISNIGCKGDIHASLFLCGAISKIKCQIYSIE